MDKRRKYAFGSSEERFGKFTFHPKLNTHLDCSDPCHYHPKEIKDIYPLKSSKTSAAKLEPWRCKAELETWSQNLGYRNQKVLRERKYLNSKLGPAFYEVKDIVCKLETPCKNTGFGREPRFKSSKGPIGRQTYFRSEPFKCPNGPHSVRPTFEREHPCRFKTHGSKWSLAPNRYKIIDKGDICEKSNKIVSIRGPYDLFTGSRDQDVKNHFCTKKTSAATWPYECKSTFSNVKKTKRGVFNKTDRTVAHRGRLALTDIAMSIKNPKEPGPCKYDAYKIEIFKQNKYGFNSSYGRPPCYQRVIVWPGVGRYNISRKCQIPGKGHKNVFLSTIERTIGAILPQPLYSF